MGQTVSILGPFPPKDFNDDTARGLIETAISNAIAGHTCVSCDPHHILGNIYIFITTS